MSLFVYFQTKCTYCAQTVLIVYLVHRNCTYIVLALIWYASQLYRMLNFSDVNAFILHIHAGLFPMICGN